MDRVFQTSERRGEALPPAGGGIEESAGGLAALAGGLAEQLVRVEANFLRLPLFTLDNKHMRTMDGMRCEGTFRRAGKSFAFSYTVTRNTATYYPGPLARSAHFALLNIATEAGLPVRNPITFGWRELCGRMGIQASGQIVTALREALTATKGLMIESRAALFSKADGKPIDTEERGQVVNLYDELEFFGTTRPDGTTFDANAVWLSHWYLDNLNALYSGPLDYALWRTFNEKSLIASRLYEFLFFKFYGGHDLLRFNYPTLVKFIPVRTERYLSHAKKQLQPAFDLLVQAGILSNVTWVESKGGLPQILLHRGPLLSTVSESSGTAELGDADFTLERIEDVHLPEWKIVSAFHEAWGNRDFRPTKGELDLARQLLATHGQLGLEALLPRLVKRLKLKWSDAKTFVAVSRYLPEVIQELERERFRAEREKLDAREHEQARQQAVKRGQDQAAVKAIWDSLTPVEQQDIRKTALAKQPQNITKFPNLIERFCLEELSRRKSIGG